MISFDWDSKKAASNLKSHGVSFEEAESVFYDDFAVQFFDDGHSSKEDRFVMLGISNVARLLTVVHCVRESGSIIRIISARKATRTESNYYKGPI
ncbi:MAG: BrnT family toxin [Pseudomonadales bacterium]|nr:BrnT family toxin [Pseudomonadales bacterium]